MAELPSISQHSTLPDGLVPAELVTRTETLWLSIMATLLGVMLVVIVTTGILGAMHPASHIEIVNPQTLHLDGEFVESNLGSALEPDGSVTVRMIAGQYLFVPRCVVVPVGAAVKFRLTSADVVHGFLIPGTNINTMVIPGFVSEVRTRFSAGGEQIMPCHEFCGLGHHAMWAHVRVVPKVQFENLSLLARTDCARQ